MNAYYKLVEGNKYSILFYSILFYSILFYSILFYSILFYSILFYSRLKVRIDVGVECVAIQKTLMLYIIYGPGRLDIKRCRHLRRQVDGEEEPLELAVDG
jgi:hypothetical protein